MVRTSKVSGGGAGKGKAAEGGAAGPGQKKRRRSLSAGGGRRNSIGTRRNSLGTKKSGSVKKRSTARRRKGSEKKRSAKKSAKKASAKKRAASAKKRASVRKGGRQRGVKRKRRASRGKKRAGKRRRRVVKRKNAKGVYVESVMLSPYSYCMAKSPTHDPAGKKQAHDPKIARLKKGELGDESAVVWKSAFDVADDSLGYETSVTVSSIDQATIEEEMKSLRKSFSAPFKKVTPHHNLQYTFEAEAKDAPRLSAHKEQKLKREARTSKGNISGILLTARKGERLGATPGSNARSSQLRKSISTPGMMRPPRPKRTPRSASAPRATPKGNKTANTRTTPCVSATRRKGMATPKGTATPKVTLATPATNPLAKAGCLRKRNGLSMQTLDTPAKKPTTKGTLPGGGFAALKANRILNSFAVARKRQTRIPNVASSANSSYF